MRSEMMFQLIIFYGLFLFFCNCDRSSESTSIVVLAQHKTGSMFLYNYFHKLCNYTGINMFSTNNAPMRTEEEVLKSFLVAKPPKLLVPYRRFEGEINLSIQKLALDHKYIFHYRNPLDVIVSRYYSFGFNHNLTVLQAKGEKELAESRREKIRNFKSISDYAISEVSYDLEYLIRVLDILRAVKCQGIVVSYTDFIHSFYKWHTKVTQFLKVPKPIRNKLYIEFKSGNITNKLPKTHIRNPTEGQHNKEFTKETNNILNVILKDKIDEVIRFKSNHTGCHMSINSYQK